MICINCEVKLPEKAKFCPSCGSQQKCTSCSEPIYPNAKVCISCGENLKKKNEDNNKNSIEYKESKDERSFKAVFTDTIGEPISKSFVSFLNNKFIPKANIQENLNLAQPNHEEIESDTIKTIEIEQSNKTPQTKIIKSNYSGLFKKKNDKWILVEPRLKAKSQIDYVRRLTILFLAHTEEIGIETTRQDLSKILTNSSIYNGNARKYLSNNSDFTKEEDVLHLTLPGRENAKNYLSEINDDSIENIWNINKGKSVSRVSKSLSLNTIDLGLNESERNNFRKFAEEKKPKGQNDTVLVVMFWLKENKGKEEINYNEIHTGIQIINKTTPKSLDSVMVNIRKDHKIEKVKNGLFKINKIGVDYVKLKLPKIKKS